MRRAAAALLLAAACVPAPPKTEIPEGAWLLPGTTWRLVEFGGAPFAARAVATLTENGRIVGEGPCNRFTADYVGRWPDIGFRLGPTTRMACPDLPAETAFFAALGRVNHATLGADGLLLTGPEDVRMRFVRE